MIPAVTLNHCALMYQNLLTYLISIIWPPSAFCDLFYFVSWIRFIQNERVIFLSWSSHLKVSILIIFWPDLSADPNIYSSSTYMVAAVTLNHCALTYQNLLTYPISIDWSLSAFCDLFYFVFWTRFIQNERVIFLTESSYLKVFIKIFLTGSE